MGKIRNICMLCFGGFLLSGCAAMSPSQCQTANWFIVGQEDAAAGNYSRLDKYHSACQKTNIVPNQVQYEKGYEAGLVSYCQPENIFNEALHGRGEYRMCPVADRARLSSYYNAARSYYDANNELERLYKDIDSNLLALDNKKLTAEQRQSYERKLSDLRYKTNRLQMNYRDALRNLERFKAENGLK